MVDTPQPPGFGHPGGDWIAQVHVDLVGLWEHAALRVIEAYDITVGPRWRIDLGVQPYAEIWLIRAGSCAVRSGNREGVARAGDVVFILPGASRSSANGSSQPLKLTGFGCTLAHRDGVELFERVELPLVHEMPSRQLTTAIRNVVRASRGADIDRIFHAKSWAAVAVAELFAGSAGAAQQLSTTRVNGGLRAEILATLDHIAASYRDPALDTRTLAALVHLSPSQLNRSFRAQLGVAPMHYLRRFRLNRARESLAETDSSVGSIAAEVGLPNVSHFSRAFKEQFGCNPRAFRTISRGLSAR